MAMKDELIHSAHILSKNQKEAESVLLFDHKMLAFQFRDKEIRKGQYRLPFSFKLPLHLPGSFKYSQYKSGGVERIMIEYSIEVYIEVPSKKKG